MKEQLDKETQREFLKDTIRLKMDFRQTDQNLGVPPPPIEKPFCHDAQRINLISVDEWETIKPVDLTSAINNRVSRRKYLDKPVTLEELSFLLWATQGVRGNRDRLSVLRTVPSAGCRHALETYLCVFNVEDLQPGIYRYLPLEHQLVFEFEEDQLVSKISTATLGQVFTGKSAVTFIWTAIPYRMEWRYGLASYKVIALDAGHVAQNLYLACEVINSGTCAIAAYNQDLMDALLKIDGIEEFVIYLAPVGKV